MCACVAIRFVLNRLLLPAYDVAGQRSNIMYPDVHLATEGNAVAFDACRGSLDRPSGRLGRPAQG
jgi:hypothetical protein